MLGLPGESFAQLGVLRRHTHRAGIEVAHPHHDAAHRDQRRRREPELLGTQQGGDQDITPGLKLAVGFNDYAGAQIVQHKRLMGFRQAQLPGNAGVFDARLR